MISAGSPRSVSNRVNASKGEVVSTPPKSQITASIIFPLPYQYAPAERLTRNALRNQSDRRLGGLRGAGYCCGDDGFASNLHGPCTAVGGARLRHRGRRHAVE